ncbi:MAG: tRNA pseudouridine(55) synthase TruB [Patescibacteria group bacterium]
MEGLLLFYKPIDWKNKDILNFFKRTFNGQKTGHSGTLDPFAEGLMVMGLGRKFTKKLHDLLLHSQKEYIAKIEFGKISDTYDIDGKIKEVKNKIKPTSAEIKSVIEKEFLGEKSQTPPVYSAKKHKGKRLRDIRESKEISEILKSKIKKVTLFDFEIISYKHPYLEIKLLVSSGFYIRSFANDLGEKLKTGAYLTELKRTKLGNYLVEQALRPEDFNTVGHSERSEESQSIELYGKISGQVQGVGFRFFINEVAAKLNINGYAKNTPDGNVEFLAQSDIGSLNKFQNEIIKGSSFAQISDYEFIIQKPERTFENFKISF